MGTSGTLKMSYLFDRNYYFFIVHLCFMDLVTNTVPKEKELYPFD